MIQDATVSIAIVHNSPAQAKYFTITPHIDDDELDPFQYRLLGHIRRRAGAKGECYASIHSLARDAKMSVSTARRALKELRDIYHRIAVDDRPGHSYRIRPRDVMAENIRRMADGPTTPTENGRGAENDTPPLPNSEAHPYRKCEDTPTENGTQRNNPPKKQPTKKEGGGAAAGGGGSSDGETTGAVPQLPKPPTPTFPGFERFWAAWPSHHRKVAKRQCVARWRAARCEEFADRVVAAVESLKNSREWVKDGGDFIPAPLVWLNQERWEAAPQAKPMQTGPTVEGYASQRRAEAAIDTKAVVAIIEADRARAMAAAGRGKGVAHG